MTPEEAKAALEKRAAKSPLSYTAEPEAIEPISREKAIQEAANYSPFHEVAPDTYNFFRSVLKAPEAAIHGILQPILERNPESGIAQQSKRIGSERQAQFEKSFQESPKSTIAGGMLGDIAATGPLGKMLPGTSTWPFLGRAIANTGIGAGFGAMNYVNPGESRLLNAAIGGAGGLIAPELMLGAGKLGGKAINAIKGYLPDTAQEIINTAQKHGVRVNAGDVSKPGSKLQGTAELLENTPIVNIKGERLAQQQEAKNAANIVLNDAEREMIKTSFADKNGMATLQKIANGEGKRAESARKIIADMKNAGDDWNYIIKTGGNANLLLHKVQSDKLYSEVGKIADKMGNVNIDNTVKRVNGYLKTLNKLPETNKDTISVIEGVRKDLMGKTKAVPASKIVDKSGKPITEAVKSKEIPKDFSFNELRQVRSALNDRISDFYAGKNTLVGQRGVRILEDVVESIDESLNKFATSNGPELKNAWKNADKYYKTNVIPYKDLKLAKALKSESNPDEIYSMFIKSGGAEGDKGTGRAKKFYDALDAKGQAAVRYGMVKNAWEHATSNGVFSPAKFATQMEKIESSRSVFFKGQAKAEIEGFTKLMRAVERSGQMKKPDTGVKNVPLLIGAFFGTKGINAVVGGVGATQALQTLMTTPKGRNFLIAASKLDERNPKWLKLMGNIGEYLGKKSHVAGATVGRAAAQNSNASSKVKEDRTE